MSHSFKILVILFLLISSTLYLTTCKKKDTIPTLTTAIVSGITKTNAVSGGNVTSDGGAEVIARGVCWGTSHNPTTSSDKTEDGTGIGEFTSNLAGLTVNTTYYVRAYASNSLGTNYGNEVSFATNQIALATLTTADVTGITPTTAFSGGNITDDGGGTITASGVCWSTAQNPTIANNFTTDGSEIDGYSSTMSGLTVNTTYYVRAYATNSAGTSYGNQVSFTTASGFSAIIFNSNLTYGTLSDIDGNVYKTIQIGSQTWMAENLKTTKFSDGTSIPNVTDLSVWDALTSPGYCWCLNNASTYKAVYGALYNWYTVNTGKICPAGWHVPSYDEWNILSTFLGGLDVAGGKLKETGTTHWQSPNEGATNESGFTALPGSMRDVTADFGSGDEIGIYGNWWSSTIVDQVNSDSYVFGMFKDEASASISGIGYNEG
jgi:uncharacterized protein (TIGR02145 family)